MLTSIPRRAVLAIALASTMLTACNYFVRRDEFDTTIADLRATDARLASQLQGLANDLQDLSRKYDAAFEADGSTMRLDTIAYFQTGDARLSGEAKRMLHDFARAINTNHANAMITVEGFTDPAGPAEFNERLGRRRAEAVRGYLVREAGLHPAQVQAVSYGEAENRQVVPGATGASGWENRRVALVVDYAGPRMSLSTIHSQRRSARR